MASIGAALDDALVQKVSTVFVFRITDSIPGGETKDWTVDVKHASGSVKEGNSGQGKADVTIIMNDADFAGGQMDDKVAFTEGKMTLVGNMMCAVRIQDVLLAARIKKNSISSKL
jgi:putative sterol carrier protein